MLWPSPMQQAISLCDTYGVRSALEMVIRGAAQSTAPGYWYAVLHHLRRLNN